ncbi:hypothetical protein [Burkholderia multivorans]|nr:hypothetical protein [Burkholderia multivorans]
MQQPAGDDADRAGPLLPTGAAHLRFAAGRPIEADRYRRKEK